MRHMAVGHQEAAVPDARDAAARRSSDVDGGELADPIGVADHQPGGLARVLEVLRDRSYRGELEDDVVRADGGVALDHRVRPDPGARSDLHLRPDHGAGSYLGGRIDLGVPIDDGGRVDHFCSVRSAMVAMISASLASCPSTLA